jgi:hypothetical protein
MYASVSKWKPNVVLMNVIISLILCILISSKKHILVINHFKSHSSKCQSFNSIIRWRYDCLCSYFVFFAIINLHIDKLWLKISSTIKSHIIILSSWLTRPQPSFPDDTVIRNLSTTLWVNMIHLNIVMAREKKEEFFVRLDIFLPTTTTRREGNKLL